GSARFQAGLSGTSNLAGEKSPIPRRTEQAPFLRTESDPRPGGGRMVRRHLDLYPLTMAAYLQFEAALAGDAPARSNRAGDAAAAAIEQFDFLRPKVELRFALGRIFRPHADR